MVRLLLFGLIVGILSTFSFCGQNTQPTQIIDPRIDSYPNFYSNYMDSVNVDIWLPEGYTESQKYAVLYMQDGQMLFDSTKTFNGQEWGVDEIMLELMRKDEIRPTIVVAIWNKEAKRFCQYVPQKAYENLSDLMLDSISTLLEKIGQASKPVFSDAYLKFTVEELKPFIDSAYSTLTDKANTFVAGSSMGGLISMYALF